MDDEEIENKLAEATHIKNSGYLDFKHFEYEKANTVGGLIKFGNHWAMSLGYALNEADLYDSIKIMRYWNHLSEQHAIMYRMYIAQENASD